MPRSTRDSQKDRVQQALNDIDRYLYNMRNLHLEYEESEAEFNANVSKTGQEWLEAYRPDYSRQKQLVIELSQFAIELQKLTERFLKELV